MRNENAVLHRSVKQGYLNKRSIKGQYVIEYAVLVAIIVMALVAMKHVLLAHISGSWRSAADRIGHKHQYESARGSAVYGTTATTETCTDTLTIDTKVGSKNFNRVTTRNCTN